MKKVWYTDEPAGTATVIGAPKSSNKIQENNTPQGVWLITRNLSQQKNVKSKDINIYLQLAITAKISPVKKLFKDIFVIRIFVVQMHMATR